MNNYVTPEAELVKFQTEDVLATSGSYNPEAQQGGGWGVDSGLDID